MKIKLLDNGTRLVFECPGCGENHGLRIAGTGVPHPCWEWNGSMEAPTLRPSILANGYRFATPDGPESVPYICHSFVTDGRIEFLSDCTHALAGQTVEIPDWSLS